MFARYVDVGGAFGGVIALAMLVILGYAFTDVFLALPGGLGWAILFAVIVVGLTIAVFAGIVRAILK